MRQTHTAPDWAALIADIRATGLTLRQIGNACGFEITVRMLVYYARGTQPLHWRGEAIIGLWLVATARTREQIPTNQVVAPYRVPRGRQDHAPVLTNLPADWPPRQPAGDRLVEKAANVLRSVGIADRRKKGERREDIRPPEEATDRRKPRKAAAKRARPVVAKA